MTVDTTVSELTPLCRQHGSMFIVLDYFSSEGKHPSFGRGILIDSMYYSSNNYYRVYALAWDDDSNGIGYIFGNNLTANTKFSAIKFYKFAFTG